MTNCKGCPFLYDGIHKDGDLDCVLEFDVIFLGENNKIQSPNCQLSVVQWSRKDKPDSETFKPQRNS